MKIDTKVLSAPSSWASAIVNLDYSGLSVEDRGELNTWLALNGLSFSDCLTCSDEYIGRFDGKLATVCDYYFTA